MRDVAGAARDRRTVAVITDVQVAKACRKLLEEAFPDAAVLSLAAGEGTKSVEQLSVVWEFLATSGLDRGGVVFALGGGVIGDLAGFAAATYQRGVEFRQVPTTLLAMVDSSVGGKTGLNLRAGKNLAGAFHQPRAVYILPEVLRTLPAREFAAGMAEVIKSGLLGDAALFRSLEKNPVRVSDTKRVAEVVRRCCAIKARVVEADEFERAASDGRALLNLGHTFAHAIERAAGYGCYLHGEAVGIGLAAAADLSVCMGLIPDADRQRIVSVLRAHRLPVKLRQPLAAVSLLEAMRKDKKVRAGRLRFVVLKKLGRAATCDTCEEAHVLAALTSIGATA
jgi:3-dehydroquinate synthase